MTLTPANHWILWQLADSAFPTGGFAHSGGVEAALQHGELRGREDLNAFLEAALGQAASSALPFVSATYDDPGNFVATDAHCDAFTSNHVANRASRLQGRAFLHSAERAFDLPALTGLREELAESPCHFAPVFGLIAQTLRLPKRDAQRLFLFTQVRGWVSSAVRLGVLGPLEAQAVQVRLAPLAEEVLLACENTSLDQIAQTAPLLDLFQGAQDRLYSRLFQS
jgi:urease accessory protein